MERLTYTVSEVAEILGISRSKAYELVAEGLIPVVPLPGRRKLVARAVVRRLLDADGANPAAAAPDNIDASAADDSPRHPSTTDSPPDQPQPPVLRPDRRPPPHTVAPGVRGRYSQRASG